VTRIIAKRWLSATVYGLDNSKEMLEKLMREPERSNGSRLTSATGGLEQLLHTAGAKKEHDADIRTKSYHLNGRGCCTVTGIL
jgi:hypothetical protein